MEHSGKGEITKRNNVRIFGKGNRTMLFGHGFGCDQNTWRSVTPYFQEDFKIVVFDYVGAGRSDLKAYRADRYSSLEGYALDVVEICEELCLTDIVFVGHSISGMIGILAQKLRADLFEQMVLIGPSPRYLNAQGYLGGIDREDLDGLLAVMDDNYQGWSQLLAPKIMGNFDRPALGEELTASFCATDPAIAKQFARVTFLSDNRKDLPSLDIPSLTIQCQQDFLTSEQVAIYIQQHTPKNQLTMLSSTGHCPHLSDPEGVANAIKLFLDR
ncbi:MAG: alpha/beta hydrolase [Pedobacter sp.]|nr:MAG: alpha/beta hydrolase [Pedobacter sp.]